MSNVFLTIAMLCGSGNTKCFKKAVKCVEERTHQVYYQSVSKTITIIVPANEQDVIRCVK